MFKVNNKDTRMTPVASLSQILYETYIKLCSSVFIVNFEQVNAGWGKY